MKCTVRKGRKYRALIEVPFFKRPFASAEIVRQRLVEAGFQDVVVQAQGAGVYWAWGVWPGEDTTEAVDYVERVDEA